MNGELSGLLNGRVYTVAKIVCGGKSVFGHDDYGVLLVEITPAPYQYFSPRRFRPVSPIHTEIIRSLLTPFPEEERENA